jgi:hypothetical protein
MQEVSTRHDHQSYDSNHMNSIVLPQALKTLLPSAMYQFCVGGLYRKNERLFLAGKVPQWMFFVTSGEVSLERMGILNHPGFRGDGLS